MHRTPPQDNPDEKNCPTTYLSRNILPPMPHPPCPLPDLEIRINQQLFSSKSVPRQGQNHLNIAILMLQL